MMTAAATSMKKGTEGFPSFTFLIKVVEVKVKRAYNKLDRCALEVIT